MNLDILPFVFKNKVHCKMCISGLDMQVSKGKSGLAITFVLKCFACPYHVEFSSSNFHEGTQTATINTRFVYAMRSIGRGAEAGRMFCRIMNLPQPPTKFPPYGKRILNAAKPVYEDSIQNIAKEVICKNEGNKNIAVAVDGTWQKRSYTSLNGVVTVASIDTGKITYSHTKDQLFGEITAVFRICGKLSEPFFCISLSTDEYPQHGFCTVGEDSWCGYKKAKHQVRFDLRSEGITEAANSVRWFSATYSPVDTLPELEELEHGFPSPPDTPQPNFHNNGAQMPENKINQHHSESFHRIGTEEQHEILTRTTMQPQRTSYTHFGYQNTESLDSDSISRYQARNEGSYHLYTNLESPSFDGQTHPKKCTDIIHLEKEHPDSEEEIWRKRHTLLESLNIGNSVTRRLGASNESIYTSKVQNVDVHKSRVQREALFRETTQKLPACSCSLVEKERCINQKCEKQSIKEGVDFKGRNEINSQKNIVKISSTKKTAMSRSRSNGKIGNRTIPLSRSKSLNSSLKVQRCINQSKPMVCVNGIYEGNASLETIQGTELVTDRNKQSSEDPLPQESHCVIALDTPRTGSESETVRYINEKVEFNVNQHNTFLPNLDRNLLADQHERQDNKQNVKEKCYLFLIYCTIMMLGTIVGAGMHSLFACAHER
ncbi:uncharacterized protein TNIN_474711 [Trichonephila inaurata madagascariensis]|uniref:Mutator-like transposase domain-containing protein n=1 Tax=Trichonephila inaurata madagascariensis TaxID=2747483 RepID=A0A8X7C824_9ARAC|nr:uncharacterized protein TNIN_474711 [Trichonephila inaurata madagascariensis]